MDRADESTKEAVKQGDLSINQAYQKTQKQRKSKKASAQATNDPTEESASGVSCPEHVVNGTTETEESGTSKNDPSTSLGKSVTVYLPDWHYNALICSCSDYIESHVRKAVDLYVESLGIRSPDDDDEYVNLDEYGD